MRPLLLAALAFALPAAAQQINPAAFVKEQTGSGILIQDPDAPVSLSLPTGWVLRGGVRSSDHQTTLSFEDTGSRVSLGFYYQHPLNPPVADAEAELRHIFEWKLKRQQEEFPDYHILSDSIRKLDIGGQPAMSYIAYFTFHGQPQQEYMLRVIGKTAKALFFLKLPATADIEGAVVKIEPIAATLHIP